MGSEMCIRDRNKNSATWKYVREAADADNQHVLDCLDFHDPGPWAREGLHTGHHWKNLTNVVEHEEFPAMFYKILKILASKEKLLIVTVCKKGTHRSVAVLVVIELLCNFLRRRVTTYEASKESLEVRGHTCSYHKNTPKSCKECDGMTTAVKMENYKNIVEKLNEMFNEYAENYPTRAKEVQMACGPRANKNARPKLPQGPPPATLIGGRPKAPPYPPKAGAAFANAWGTGAASRRLARTRSRSRSPQRASAAAGSDTRAEGAENQARGQLTIHFSRGTPFLMSADGVKIILAENH